MKKRLLWLLQAALVCVPIALNAGLTDPSLRWKTVFTEHFAITYHEGEEETARKMTVIAEEVYKDLSQKFDARPWGRTEVVLIDNHDQANGFTLVIPYNLVVLRTVPPISDTTLGDYDHWLRELFTHEYTHVIHITDTRYPARALKFLFGTLVAPNGLSPGWVTEGLATYFETVGTTRGRGRSSFTEMLLRTDVLQDRFLHLDQMAGNQYDWPSWQAQYLYGVGFWRFLAERYGEEKLIEFSHKYGSSLRFGMLNSHAKRVWGKERTPEEEELCAEKHYKTHKTYRTHKTYPETCGNRGLTLYKLWDEWKQDLTERTAEVRTKVEAQGLKEGDGFLVPEKGESFTLPTLSRDGKSLAYLATSVHHHAELRVRDLETGKERILLKKRDLQQMSFSPDGQRLVLSNTSGHKRYNEYSDLSEIDLETGKVKKLTKGKRARDPDYSPDGNRIVAVIQETEGAKLGVYDPEKEEWKIVHEANQFDHPRWMPDGRSIVVSVHREGRRDLWIIDSQTREGRRVTKDVAIDDRPAVDYERREVYFSSDETGIPNIYRYDPDTKSTRRVTNVLTGAFSPAVAPDGSLYYQHYNGTGFEIRKVEGARKETGLKYGGGSVDDPAHRPPVGLPVVGASEGGGAPSESKKYNPFRKLFIPRYILPNVSLVDGSVFASMTVSNTDPLHRHYWFGDVTYRSDNDFVGYDFGYTYSRFRPSFSVGISDFTVNYGDVFRLGADFFEERRRIYGGTTVPLGFHNLTAQYFFEDRSAQSGLPAGVGLPTLGNYAGLFLRYGYGKTSATAAAISPEAGDRFNVNLEVTNGVLGSSDNLEQQVVWADARKYIKMPYAQHHVIALRAAGGAAFGDQLLQGNFVLGGSLGESPFTGSSSRLFTLRGLPLSTFAADRAWIGSVEYRMPLFRLQRGPGTLPFFLNSAHLAFFADVGDAFNKGAASFRPLLGIGAEIRGNFVVGWHLPVMGRLGYGVIVTNRDRIAGVTDSLTGADARNGVVILELGTSF